MWCITLIDLQVLNHPCIPRINPTWSWYKILLMYCWIWFAITLLRIFASTFISDIDVNISTSVHQCQIKSWRQSFGWSRKEYLYCFARQRETRQAPALETYVSQPREFGEEFYDCDSRVGLLIRLGCVQGLHSSNWSQVIFLMSFSGSFNLASDVFLAAPPLINNCSYLPFGTQGRSWRLGSVPYK